jgi:hypothetical protein
MPSPVAFARRQSTDPNSVRLLVQRPADDANQPWWSRITDDGRTAFVSTRAELVADLPPSDHSRLFAVDVATNDVRLVTDDWRFQPRAASADGRFIVGAYEFGLDDNSAVAIDTVTSVIHTFDLGEPITFLRDVSISLDGTTAALSLTTGLGPSLSDERLFIVDMATGHVEEPLAGADGALWGPRLSSDGSIVAFSSYAENLDMAPGNSGSDPVVYDRRTGTLSYALTTMDGDVPNDQSTVLALSDDANTVLINSWASNLGGQPLTDTDFKMRPYLFDRTTGRTEPLSIPDVDTMIDWSIVDTSNDLNVLAVASSVGVTSILYDVAADESRSLYGPGVVPNAGLLASAYDGISLDATGDVAVFASGATNLGPDADEIADVFIVGAPEPQADGEPYSPPEHPLPATTIGDNKITPPKVTPSTTPAAKPAPRAPVPVEEAPPFEVGDDMTFAPPLTLAACSTRFLIVGMASPCHFYGTSGQHTVDLVVSGALLLSKL